MQKESAVLSQRPITLTPALMKLVGVDYAILIQQIKYALSLPRSGVEIDGHRWIWNTYETWQEDWFPFWNLRTIRRRFRELEDMGVIVSCQPDGRLSRKKYYRLNEGYMSKFTIENAVLLDIESDVAKLAASN